MNSSQQQRSSTQGRVLKRVNSTGDINMSLHRQQIESHHHENEGAIKDRYNDGLFKEDEDRSDDDEILQKSSIISYQESKQENGGDMPFNQLHHKRLKKFQNQQLQEEDITQMDNESLQRYVRSLREAIAELYLGIKQKTRDENDLPTPQEEQEEREIIMQLDSYTIIDYIKSSVDIILNLKFEEIEKRLLDKNHLEVQDSKKSFKRESQLIESERSSLSNAGGPCPQVYEELIQQLEGDIRKHIRIEQQLKLHIESMENRIEELESQNEKIEGENTDMKEAQQSKIDKRLREIEESVKRKDETIRLHESAIRVMKESEGRFRKEIEELKATIKKAQAAAVTSSKVIDPFSLIGQAIDNASRNGGEVMSKTQPMIIKQSSAPPIAQQNQQLLNKMSFQNNQEALQFGSYSSNHSFAEGASPDRRTATPDLNHPYLHQTQLMSRKKSGGGPGTGSKTKKYLPNSVVDSLGLQSQFNGVNSTYSTGGSSGKVIGQRKLSSQHTRNHHQTSKGIPVKAITQNSWIGQMNNGSFGTTGQTVIGGPQPQFSNIINNNIQGLSINYSNQIIADPIQQFANNFLPQPQSLGIGSTQQNLGENCNEDSESSNLNSHRRCKSQNVKRNDNASKSVDRNKTLKQNNYGGQDLSHDMILMHQVNENSNLKFKKHPPMSNQATAEDEIKSSFMLNESTRGEGGDQFPQRRAIKNQANSVTQQTLNAVGGGYQSKTRTASNRVQQQNTAVDEFAKNRFNQSYGGGQSITSVVGKHKISAASSNTRNNNTMFNHNPTSQSMEKTRSRNKKGQLSQNQTVNYATGAINNQYSSKFDNNIFDLNFKTTGTVSNQQQKNGTAPQSGVSQAINNGQIGHQFLVPNKNNSATNTAAFLNQTNIQILKQQILAHKKASNLLMKGLSPLKK